MKFAKKVYIPVNLSTEVYQQFAALKAMPFLTECDVHFVHVFRTTTYAHGFVEYPLTYPIPEDRKAIQESTESMLTNLAKESLPAGFKGKFSVHCLFSDNPKAEFAEFVTKKHADLVIIPTRKKHGIFESSFANYVSKHTEANLILLKQ